MKNKLAEIARLINGELAGAGDIMITGVSGIKEAQAGDITFLANSKYLPLVEKCKASAIIIPRDLPFPKQMAAVRVDNPSLAFSKVVSSLMSSTHQHVPGIHKTAVIAQDAVLGKNVSIGPYTVIESKAQIGEGTIIYSGCYVGHETIIGKNGLIYPNVVIRERVVIGQQVVIHSGTVIGSDGFGFVSVEGVHEKIPQVGTVVIEDNVEIGANVAIDRARFDKTVIGKGTKIDNLVQIAHNVIIGENCIIVSQVGISGSCILENNVVLAGQVGLAGHLTIGANSVVASQSGVPSSIPPNSVYWGFPAKPIMEAKRVNAAVQRLPHYVKVLNELKKRVEELEAKLKNKS